MKPPKITLKRCRELLERHYSSRPQPRPDYSCSDEITPRLLGMILEAADLNSRFKVSYDPASHDEDDDTWDVVGPGLPYGRVYFETRGDAEEARDALNSILRDHMGPVRRSSDLSLEAHRNKMVLEGACCPACGSSKVCLNEDSLKGSVYEALRDCTDCNAEWKEVYGFHGYQDLRID